jgi:drug/metabolite transporter (DMT)-like permease
MPLSSAVLLQSTGPIFVPILALLIYQRVSDRHVWFGVLIAFVGVAFIVRPSGFDLSVHQISGILAGIAGGAATLSIWAMSSTEPPSRQMFYFTLFTLVLSLIPLPWSWQLPTGSSFVFLVLLAICTTLAQYFLAAGFRVAPADKINTWSYASILLAAVIGYVGWGEHFGLSFGLGALLIISGAHLTTRTAKQAVLPKPA